MIFIRTISLGSVVTVILAGLSAAAPAARAADNTYDDIQTRQVSTQGLDLSSPAGQATLRHRIARAAASVCGSFDVRDLLGTSDYEQCRALALKNAWVDASVLIAKAGTVAVAVVDVGALRP